MKWGVLRTRPNIVRYSGNMSINYHIPSLKRGVRSPNNPERVMIIELILPDVQHLMGERGDPWQRCASGLILFIKQNVIKTLPYAHLRRGRESSGVVRRI